MISVVISEAGDRAAAVALGEEADRRTDELSRDPAIPPDLYGRAADAGLFRQLVPSELGGLGRSPQTWFRTGVELARHEASFGWVITQGAAILGQLAAAGHAELRTTVLSTPRAAIAVSIAGMGQVRHGPDGARDQLTVQGRWGSRAGARARRGSVDWP